MKKFILSFFILIVFSSVFAQKGDPTEAERLIKAEQFEMALIEYGYLLADNPNHLDYNYYMGICYLNTDENKIKSIPYFEKVEKSNSYNNNIYYVLARAYHYNYQFDKAIDFFNRYKKNGGGTAASTLMVDKEIEYCFNAKELIKYPLDVTFENLGNRINSSSTDYFPFVPEDESFIVFNSKRREFTLPEDNTVVYPSDVYISYVQNGDFQAAQEMGGNINSLEGIEEVVGLSYGGDYMLLYKEENKDGNLYLSHYKDDVFQKPIKLDESINSKNHEIAASINAAGDHIYFASNRPGGYGGTDIYVCKKMPIGGWGPAQNLGPSVNTPYDEDFPNIDSKGAYLYFSSKGHTSMGGYDIFKSKWDQEKKAFTNIENMGYPINTVFDDMNLRVSKTGRYGYMASLKEKGFGNYDLYRIVFNDVDTRYTVFKGFVKTDDNNELSEIIMEVSNKYTGELYGSYLPNMNTMRYIIILPPGEYNLYVESPGYAIIEKEIKVLDKNSFQPTIDVDIKLLKE